MTSFIYAVWDYEWKCFSFLNTLLNLYFTIESRHTMQLLGNVLNDSLIDENLLKWFRHLNKFPNRIYVYIYGCLTWHVFWCLVTLAFVSSFRLPPGLYPPLSFSRGVVVTCHTSSHLAVHVIIADWCEQQEVWFVPPKPFSPIGSFTSQSRPVTSQGAHLSALCHH